LIETRKGKTGGAFITRGDPKVVAGGMADLLRLGNTSFQHLTEARLWIEEIIVRAACERATAADLEALARNVAEAEQLSGEGRRMEKTLKNIEFHDLLARATKNPVLEVMARTMNDVMRAFAERLGSDPSRAVIGSREKLLAAIKGGRARAAVEENAKALRAIHRFYATASKRKAP
jgi:DNA-binding FadR family transcriptional regulator